MELVRIRRPKANVAGAAMIADYGCEYAVGRSICCRPLSLGFRRTNSLRTRSINCVLAAKTAYSQQKRCGKICRLRGISRFCRFCGPISRVGRWKAPDVKPPARRSWTGGASASRDWPSREATAMLKWVLPTVLLALLSASGCCCGPCGSCGPCGGGYCGPGWRPGKFLVCGLPCKSACGPSCGPSCGPDCGPSCGSAGCCPSLTCSPCGGGIKYWLNGRCYCGKSCCDRYWGEWVSDPPDCCDPCNQCGNFVGPRGCGPGPIRRLLSHIACNSCCNSCGGAGCDICGGGYVPGHSSPGCSTCGGGHGHSSLMHENWDHKVAPPVPGKNIHQAGQPTPAIRTSQRPMQVSMPVAQQRPVSGVQQATMRR